MRLQTKMSLLYICFSTLLFVVGGMIYYGLVKSEIDEDVDDRLNYRKQRLAEELVDLPRSPSIGVIQQITTIDKLSQPEASLKDTLIFNEYDNEFVPYRQLTCQLTANGRNFHVVLRQSLIEPQDLLESILLSMGAIFAILVIGLWVLNSVISRRLWAPFHDTLRKIREYDLIGEEPLVLEENSTEEFQNLNNVIEAMTARIRRDMLNLKEFSENASHEMQTPLAVIISELEGLIDKGQLDENLIGPIGAAHEAATRLSQLNKALILLTRLEGRDYLAKAAVRVAEEIEAVLAHYADMIESKNITIKKAYIDDLTVEMNPSLARVLITNLLRNAVVHSTHSGTMSVTTKGSTLIIENTGQPLKSSPESLFERFKKENQTSSSLGLGLSIVKRICEINQFSVTYTCLEDRHILSIVF